MTVRNPRTEQQPFPGHFAGRSRTLCTTVFLPSTTLPATTPRLLASSAPPLLPQMAESKFAHLPISLSPDADLKKQLCEVPGTKRPGQTRTSCNYMLPHASHLIASSENATQHTTVDVSNS